MQSTSQHCSPVMTLMTVVYRNRQVTSQVQHSWGPRTRSASTMNPYCVHMRWMCMHCSVDSLPSTGTKAYGAISSLKVQGQKRQDISFG